MSFTSLPARIDLECVANTDAGFEFVLVGDGGVINISNDIVQMIVVDSYGGTPVLLKANGVGQHADPANGVTQFLFTTTELRTGLRDVVTWWYEVRRLIGGNTARARVHMQGEFLVLPSMAL
jgi:hypothetical protein